MKKAKTDAEREAEQQRKRELRRAFPKFYAALRGKPAKRPRPKPPVRSGGGEDLPPAARYFTWQRAGLRPCASLFQFRERATNDRRLRRTPCRP